MIKKHLTPELYGVLETIQLMMIPEEDQAKAASLGISKIFFIRNPIPELGVYGNHIIEFSDASYVDMSAPQIIRAIIECLENSAE